MKRFLKILLVVILLFGLLYMGYRGYRTYIAPAVTQEAFILIPDDAIYIIETTNLSEGWEKISDSKVWKHLMGNAYFEDINEQASGIDQVIKNNRAMDLLLADRQLLVSAHMVSAHDYDFLFVINIGDASNIASVRKTLSFFNYTIREKTYHNENITELIDDESGEILYITIINNLLACSYSGVLIEAALDQKDQEHWKSNERFQLVKDEISDRKLFNFYVNYDQIDEYLNIYLSEGKDIAKDLSEILEYSAFNANLENERITLKGYTKLSDSVSSYLSAISRVFPAKGKAHEIISSKAALYLSLTFDDYVSFQRQLEKEYAAKNENNYKGFMKQLNRLEKLLRVNLESEFFDWIGNEIAFVKMAPSNNVSEKDVVMVIHSHDIEDAKRGLLKITKRIPLNFKTVTYQNHEIHYMAVKGFFKLFFGDMIKNMHKPYFTFIEDFVVFSNSQTLLMNMIDDYVKGKTLARSEKFMDFKDEFSRKANVSIFVQMPKMYQHLYNYNKADKRKGIKENKELILSFSRIGFQLISESEILQTTLAAEHDEEALFEEVLEKISVAADELFNESYESLSFKVTLPEEELIVDGPYRAYYEDSTLKYEGKVVSGVPEGLWRSYYKNGSLESTVYYDKGKVNGTATFYYDNELTKAEMNFEDDKIEGLYREFYDTGGHKALLNYEDGKADGRAEFYYVRGSVKIKGKFRDGKRSGKWKYYTENGELYDKARWRREQ